MSLPSTVQLNCGQTLPGRYAKSALSEHLSDDHGIPFPSTSTFINILQVSQASV